MSVNTGKQTNRNSDVKPIIAIICCYKLVDNEKAQAVKARYIDCVYQFGGLPILLPALPTQGINTNRKVTEGELTEIKQQLSNLFARVDGIILTGSYSNVDPKYYGGNHDESYTDVGRDVLSFELINYAKKHKMPLLAICRGHQELNVAYGGSLYPDYRTAGYTETHLYPADLPAEKQYQPIHDIDIKKDTLLAEFNASINDLNNASTNSGNLESINSGNLDNDSLINDGFKDENAKNENAKSGSDKSESAKSSNLESSSLKSTHLNCSENKDNPNQQQKWAVNSLHNQCIAQLANELQTMAVAPDSLIEAIYDPEHPFMVGVQWHPEGCTSDPLSQFLFNKLISTAKNFNTSSTTIKINS